MGMLDHAGRYMKFDIKELTPKESKQLSRASANWPIPGGLGCCLLTFHAEE